MTELPERRVLKDLLVKLKSKAITSAEELRKSEQTFGQEVEKYQKEFAKVFEMEDIKKSATMLNLSHNIMNLIDTVSIHLKDYSNSVHRNTDDSSLYLEALEKYSTELDNTLTSIFERATKQAEEQIRQQEELSKKTSPRSYTT